LENNHLNIYKITDSKKNMLSFNKTEIDTWRVKFHQDYQQKTAKLDYRSIDYFILPKDIFKDPNGKQIPNGLFRMTGEPRAGYLVGVSEQVPEELKPYFALSEHDEFMVYGLGDPMRTLHSEQKIVSLLNPDLKDNYVKNKLKLYRHITREAKGDLPNWRFTLNDYNGFLCAMDYLKQV
tara:strand:- start:114774 stop:115310 length:537 start_codon:yes stop_codon:yes gene_type:complete